MNHTPNYNLPQWELDDLIRMEDFNAAMASIETGIDGAKAEAKAGDAELQRQVTAANTKAEAAQSAAAQLPYVVGSYVGGPMDEVVLGFRPSVVIIFSGQYGNSTTETAGRVVVGGDLVTSNRLFITDQGFRVAGGSAAYPVVNVSGLQFQYIAFR